RLLTCPSCTLAPTGREGWGEGALFMVRVYPRSSPELVGDPPARLLVQPRAKRAAIAGVLEIPDLLGHRDQGLLRDLLRLDLGQAGLARDVAEQRRVIVVELAPGCLPTPILQPRQQAR